MVKIIKMDLYRLRHSTILYVCLGFITMMAVAMVMSDSKTTLDTLMGIANSVAKEDAFMTSTTGAGVINILLGITLALFISGDFSSGFIKNIFTVHANLKDYYLGKLTSFSLLSGFMLLFYTIECLVALAVLGNGIVFSAGVLGFLIFLLEKWFLSIAFCGVILLLTLITRKAAWGIIVGFIIATGGIAMMIPGLAAMLHLNFLNYIYMITLSGTASSITMNFSLAGFVHVLIVGLLWIAIPVFVAIRVLPKKDII